MRLLTEIQVRNAAIHRIDVERFTINSIEYPAMMLQVALCDNAGLVTAAVADLIFSVINQNTKIAKEQLGSKLPDDDSDSE